MDFTKIQFIDIQMFNFYRFTPILYKNVKFDFSEWAQY